MKAQPLCQPGTGVERVLTLLVHAKGSSSSRLHQLKHCNRGSAKQMVLQMVPSDPMGACQSRRCEGGFAARCKGSRVILAGRVTSSSEGVT